jgi:hypothetical protein
MIVEANQRLSQRGAARVRRREVPVVIAAVLCVCLLGAFFAVPYLPMVDLAQHAAQISIWLHLDDPSFTDAQRFVLNLRTPYLGAYVATWLLAHCIGVLAALKCVVWLSIVGQVAAFDALVRRLRYSRWLTLIGVPLSLGYGFYFGFISFNAALPFGILAISAALDHRSRRTLRTGLVLGAALCAVLACHGFVLGMTLAVVLPLLCRGGGRFIARVAPLLAPLLLGVIWLAPGSSARSIGLTIWEPRFLDLQQVPALLLATSAEDHAASVLGVIFLGVVLLNLGQPSRDPERIAPLALMILGYCLFPLALGGFGPLHPRFAAYIVPTLLIAFDPRRRPLAATSLLTIVPCFVWLALFEVRLMAYAKETQPIVDFVARMPAGLRVRPVVFERSSRAFPGLPTFMHLSAYYAAVKGGLQGYSFAMYPTSVIRYRPNVTPTMSHGEEWLPESFSAGELDTYDCILVHSHADRTLELFNSRARDAQLVFHEADWWAYLKTSSARSTSRQQTGVSLYD